MGRLSDVNRGVPVTTAAAATNEIDRNVFSYLTYSWITPMLKTGWNHPLQEDDLPNVPSTKRAAKLSVVLDPFWKQLTAHAKDPSVPAPSFFRLLAANFWKWPLLISDVVNVFDPASQNNALFHSIYAYAFIYFVLSILAAIGTTGANSVNLDIRFQARAIIISAVYRKSLQLSPASRAKFTPGRITSLISMDVKSIAEIPGDFNNFVASLVQIALGLYLIARSLAVSTWLSVGTYFFVGILVVVTFPFLGKGQASYLRALNVRTSLLREFLYAIKILKMGCREHDFLARISAARTVQLRALVAFLIPMFAVVFLMTSQQMMLPVITIVGLDKLGGSLTAANVFPILGLRLLGMLLGPTIGLAGYFGHVVKVVPSITRLTSFLLAAELDTHEVTENFIGHDDASSNVAVKLDAACFAWTEAEAVDPTEEAGDSTTKDEKRAPETDAKSLPAAALIDITLSIPKGTLTVILGSVGSGKTQLLAGLAGAIKRTAGTSRVYGSIAYCEQTPWLISGTIEDNICGLFCDGDWNDALRAARSATTTESSCPVVSVRRVALARAVASDADVLLLDDPLAALDATVGSSIFHNTLRGSDLSGKTILLVTSQLQCAASADLVVVMDRVRVAESGTYQDLVADSDSHLSLLFKDRAPDDGASRSVILAQEDEEQLVNEARKVVADYENEEIAEDRLAGAVTQSTYRRFLSASSVWCVGTYAILWPIGVGLAAWQMITLVKWSGDTESDISDRKYFDIYWGTGVGVLAVAILETAMSFASCYRAAKSYHDRALEGLVSAPISWWAAS
ncbi:hypothetical protein HKX48_008206 [Thoreauomyces humboldtii]|nr:hypothetical protein HKX48_008206 [Thoreauomyces humboldtii]